MIIENAQSRGRAMNLLGGLCMVGLLIFLCNGCSEHRKADEMPEKRETPTSGLHEEMCCGSTGVVKIVELPGGEKLELVYCPPGEFHMGSPMLEAGRGENESLHRVRVTKGFWIGKYEVTQAQWRSVMKDNPSNFKGDSLPVERVSWSACQDFLAKAGTGFRLPTESEWEYACRAGSSGPYAGTGKIDEMGWCSEDSGNVTHCVGCKSANAWGIYDMHGNVWEWCQDCYEDCLGEEIIDRMGCSTGDFRVFRGGGWSGNSFYSRSAARNRGLPNSSACDLGFRVAVSQE